MLFKWKDDDESCHLQTMKIMKLSTQTQFEAFLKNLKHLGELLMSLSTFFLSRSCFPFPESLKQLHLATNFLKNSLELYLNSPINYLFNRYLIDSKLKIRKVSLPIKLVALAIHSR